MSKTVVPSGGESVPKKSGDLNSADSKNAAVDANKKEVDVAQRTEDSLDDFKNEIMNFFNEEVVAIKDEITKINKRYNDDQAPVVTPDPIEQLMANARSSVPSDPVNRVEPAPQLLGIDNNQAVKQLALNKFSRDGIFTDQPKLTQYALNLNNEVTDGYEVGQQFMSLKDVVDKLLSSHPEILAKSSINDSARSIRSFLWVSLRKSLTTR